MTSAGRRTAQDKGLEAMLARLQRTAKARAGAPADRHAAGAPETARDVRSAPGPAPAGTGRSNRALVAAATHTLETVVRQRGLEQTELCPTSEYPTPLTRLPLFPPVTRATAIELFKRGWTRVASPWDGGGVFRSGPALNVYDEDTLLGLMVLRAWRLEGPADRLPVPVRSGDAHDRRPAAVVKVDTLNFRISQLESAIRGYTPKGGWSGHAAARRRQSLDDLAGLQLRFDKPHGSREYSRETVSLFRTPGFSKDTDACYYVQFDPLVSQWLENYCTYIDLALRRKLSDLGRAIHRFLASQRSNRVYRIALAALYEAIGAPGCVGKLNQQARLQLAIMQRDRFIASFAIAGTGRAQPFVLQVQFPGPAPTAV
jgi:hypothetical protein